MDQKIPWYQSAIIRQQIVQLIVACLALAGIATDIDWGGTIDALFGGIAAAVAIWTIITRLFKPAPNITTQAQAREGELVARGIIPPQRGFARVGALGLVAAAGAMAMLVMSGCAGTQSAYRAAQGSLPDTAYVVAEHYSAVLREAADIAALPGTPAAVKQALQQADRTVKPFIIGDPATQAPGLQQLVERYQAIGGAQTELELQAAIDDAIRELSNFIRAVKAARSRS